MAERISFTSVVKNRGFLNLWVNQILVQLSYNALNFTLIFWVFRLTGSHTAISALLFSIYLPAVILGLFTGVLVDLMDKRKIIMIVDFFLSLTVLSLIFTKNFYPAILLTAFLVNTLGQFYTPTEASAIPLIVKREQLITANSIFSVTLYTTFLLGFGLAGLLINHFGIDLIFAAGGILLFTAFILAFFFPPIVARPDEEGIKLVAAIGSRRFSEIKKIGMQEILETIKMIRGKLAVLTSILILGAVQMVIGVLAVLIPSFLERIIHIKATDSSYVMVLPLGFGIVSGGLVLGKIGSRLVKRVVVTKAIIVAGMLFLLMGITPIFSPGIRHLHQPQPLPFTSQPFLSIVLVTGSFILGIAMVSILVPSQTVLQEYTPDEDRGKVFAVLGVAMAALSILPVFLAGILADIFGVLPIFICFGVIILFIGLFGLKPSLFFSEDSLPYKIRAFLGLGHWEKE